LIKYLYNKALEQISDLQTKVNQKQKDIDEINKEFVQAVKDWKSLVQTEKQKVKELEELDKVTNSDRLVALRLYEEEKTKRWKFEKQLQAQPKQIVDEFKKFIKGFTTINNCYISAQMIYSELDNILKKYEEKNNAEN